MGGENELFRFICRAGGLSEGFARLIQGIAHIESNKSAAETLETRMAYYYLKEENKLDIYREYQKTFL